MRIDVETNEEEDLRLSGLTDAEDASDQLVRWVESQLLEAAAKGAANPARPYTIGGLRAAAHKILAHCLVAVEVTRTAEDPQPPAPSGDGIEALRAWLLAGDGETRIPVHRGEQLVGYVRTGGDGRLRWEPEQPELPAPPLGGHPSAVAEAPDLAAAREIVLAQLTRTIERRLHRGDLVDLAASPELSRAAQAAAAAVLDLAVLLPPGWSLEWLQDPQERIPVAQAEPVAYPTAGRAAGLIRYHLQNADIGEADRGELAAAADLLDAPGATVPTVPSYHDLHITTDTIPRTSIFNLPYGIEVSCTRVSGWQVWDMNRMQERVSVPLARSQGVSSIPLARGRLLAGEYNAEPEENEEGRPVRGGLRLDVAGFVIVDSLGKGEHGHG